VIKNFFKKYPLLIVIMVSALIIRLIAGYVQSFSNDELSALYRLQFNNFPDLIHWGVKVDGHPALVQLLLYAYTPLVGKSELLIRLPFILASTLSLGYIFFSLKKLSGEFTAYMVVIILAFAGFSIQLGYFARPYALGILFTSMAIYYWIRIFIEQEKGKKNLVLFILVSILACYTHYFALLEIAMLGAASFLFAPVKTWWKIMLAGLIVILAYLPNYPILAFQLSVGGIGGWLGKPKNYFLVDMVMEYFDRSPLIMACFVLFPLLVAIIQPAKPVLKRIALYLFLSLVPFCLLYFYSIHINSLLQFSACFFFMPFLLAAFFSLFESGKETPVIAKWGYITTMVVFWGSVLIFNSAFAPIHFGEFKRIAQYIEEHESDSVTTVVAVNNPFYIDWYLKDKKPDLYITDMGDNLNFLKRYIDSCKTPEFIYAFTNQRSNGEIPFMIRQNFYAYIASRYFNNGEYYHFSKKAISDWGMYPINKFEYNNLKNEFVRKGPDDFFDVNFSMEDMDEFSPTFEMKLRDLKVDKNYLLVATIGVAQYKFEEMEIVMTVENPGKEIFWRSRKFSNQYANFDTTGKINFFRIVENFDDKSIDLKNGVLKVYVWNPYGGRGMMGPFIIETYYGNPFTSSYSQ
jgi:hypothetical protein